MINNEFQTQDVYLHNRLLSNVMNV